MQTARQTVRHVCAALKRYFEIHLAWKVEHLQRQKARDLGGSPPPSTPHNKAIKLQVEQVQDLIFSAHELMPYRANWPPVSKFIELGGIQLMLQVSLIYLLKKDHFAINSICFYCTLYLMNIYHIRIPVRLVNSFNLNPKIYLFVYPY